MSKTIAAYAVDAIGLIDDIKLLPTGMDSAGFAEQRVIRLAVERQFIGLGEALAGLKRLDPGTASCIADLDLAIGLRNVLAHQYENIMADRLWAAVESLPVLPGALDNLLVALERGA